MFGVRGSEVLLCCPAVGTAPQSAVVPQHGSEALPCPGPHSTHPPRALYGVCAGLRCCCVTSPSEGDPCCAVPCLYQPAALLNRLAW